MWFFYRYIFIFIVFINTGMYIINIYISGCFFHISCKWKNVHVYILGTSLCRLYTWKVEQKVTVLFRKKCGRSEYLWISPFFLQIPSMFSIEPTDLHRYARLFDNYFHNILTNWLGWTWTHMLKQIPPRILGIWEPETILNWWRKIGDHFRSGCTLYTLNEHVKLKKLPVVSSGAYVFYVEFQDSYHAITESEMFHAFDNSRGWAHGNLQGLWPCTSAWAHL